MERITAFSLMGVWFFIGAVIGDLNSKDSSQVEVASGKVKYVLIEQPDKTTKWQCKEIE
jgi:hypothetical protein